MRWLPLLILLLGCNPPVVQGQLLGPLQTVKDGFTSSFLLLHDDGALLFDAGFAAGAGPIERALREHDLALSDVTDVLLTHAHGDHVAGLAALPQATVWALPSERDLFAEEAPEGAVLSGELEAGELPLGGRAVEVFPLPGHTAGSAAFLVEGVLVLGDSGIAVQGGGYAQVGANFSDDTEQIDRSLAALVQELTPRADEIEWLALSHSAPLEGLQPLIDYVESRP
jgi:glyoxylase-like metal-dependent hydrolase (beta-lactamase superfamily II)